jgi:hypothetical protein
MAKKKTKINEQIIVDLYMTYRLEGLGSPDNVYQFCKAANIDEGKFYSFFSSMKMVSEGVYEEMHKSCMELLSKDEAFQEYDSKTKLLAYYYTLFEIFTANRSYILMDLEGMNIKKLSKLKEHFARFINILAIEPFDIKRNEIQKLQSKTIQEAFFGQLLATTKFWMDDNSKGFEKTDLYIEKSVQASFEILKTLNMKSVLDFGKFLLKEKLNVSEK